MHQFVEAGIALYNPDDPARPVNSPNACYQASEEAVRVIVTFGTDAWQAALGEWLEARKTLSAKWARDREMQMIPVTVALGREITLSPGPSQRAYQEHPRLVRSAFRSWCGGHLCG